ncbi:MAG TPA: DUF1990 domain-containing protein [Longimicrobium sp.]|jgi:uncharacterized protein (UPF0548 family)
MFLPRRPSSTLVGRVLATQRAAPLSYPEGGMTRSDDARGYPRNHHETVLGSGSDVYARAVAAVRGWAMYDLPWTELHPPGAPVAEGTVVATVVRHLGFWSINPCRVVYVDEEETPALSAFSFGIGTLPLHSERGEERFRVEWDRSTGEVRFEILAYAVAHHWMARLSGPYVRILQRRFGRAALEAVRARVARG